MELDRFDSVLDRHSTLGHTPFIEITISSVDFLVA